MLRYPLAVISSLSVAVRLKTLQRLDLQLTIRRSVSLALLISLLSSSTVAAPQTLVGIAKETRAGVAFWFRVNDIANLLQGNRNRPEHKQEKQEDREARISRLQIYPGDLTMSLAERATFSAVAYDHSGNAIGWH